MSEKVVKFLGDPRDPREHGISTATTDELFAELKGAATDKPLGFATGDHLDCAFRSRDWLRSALEKAGAEVTGSSMGCGAADLDITLDGARFVVSILPLTA